jgi:hypothetical protein
LSGKEHLPRRSVRSGRAPAHIGEAFLALPDGDPEGSPCDPVTTDPKGEARRVDSTAAGNTPALAELSDFYGRTLIDDKAMGALRKRGEVKG